MAFSDLYNFPFNKGDVINTGSMAALKRACEQFYPDWNVRPVRGTFMGFNVAEDPSLSSDVVEIRSADGKVLGRIVGIGE